MAKAGKQAHIVVVNAASAVANISSLTDVTKAPVHQDTAEVDAWGLHGISKDDILIYDSQGKLVTYLPMGGSVSTVLQDDAGFAAVLAALLAVL